MRQLFIILSLIFAILGLALSILPFGSIAYIPIIAGFIFGLFAFKISQKNNKSTQIIKGIFLVVIVSLCISIYRSIFETNVIEKDNIETLKKEKQSEQETINELESIDIEE
jgi:phosphotransferase system  glucose/maltose/N-acetylglucosamine-specific IIC component